VSAPHNFDDYQGDDFIGDPHEGLGLTGTLFLAALVACFKLADLASNFRDWLRKCP